MGAYPVGGFSGDHAVSICNVTRYIGLIENKVGQPGSRKIKWAHYYGFYQHVFSHTDIKNNYGKITCTGSNTARCYTGELLNNCLHRYSDSRPKTYEKTQIIPYSRFGVSVHSATCDEDQKNYRKNNGNDAGTYFNCLKGAQTSQGRWSMHVRLEEDGRVLGSFNDTYLWGFLENFTPPEEMVYIIEELPGKVHFNRSNYKGKKLSYALLKENADGTVKLEKLGAFPIDEFPKINSVRSWDRKISTTGQKLVEFEKADIDKDGRYEIKMESGEWVGFDRNSAKLVVKKAK